MAQAINDAIRAVEQMTDEERKKLDAGYQAELARSREGLAEFRRLGEGRRIDERLEDLERRHREQLEDDGEKLTAA